MTGQHVLSPRHTKDPGTYIAQLKGQNALTLVLYHYQHPPHIQFQSYHTYTLNT
jgi:hypothetical protein